MNNKIKILMIFFIPILSCNNNNNNFNTDITWYDKIEFELILPDKKKPFMYKDLQNNCKELLSFENSFIHIKNKTNDTILVSRNLGYGEDSITCAVCCSVWAESFYFSELQLSEFVSHTGWWGKGNYKEIHPNSDGFLPIVTPQFYSNGFKIRNEKNYILYSFAIKSPYWDSLNVQNKLSTFNVNYPYLIIKYDDNLDTIINITKVGSEELFGILGKS